MNKLAQIPPVEYNTELLPYEELNPVPSQIETLSLEELPEPEISPSSLGEFELIETFTSE